MDPKQKQVGPRVNPVRCFFSFWAGLSDSSGTRWEGNSNVASSISSSDFFFFFFFFLDGAPKDQPFAFQPGVGLIQGWSEGVLQMKEGERAWLHVPSAK